MSRSKRTKSTNKRSKRRGYGSSSGSSLLRELEGKYSSDSLTNTASVDKMMDELDPSSKKETKENSDLGKLGVGVGLTLGLVGVLVGLKVSKKI